MASLMDEAMDSYMYSAYTPYRYLNPKHKGGGWRQRGYLASYGDSAEYFDNYQRAQLKAILSQVNPNLTPRLRKANTRDVGVQVNPRQDASVQCSLGPRTLARRRRGAPRRPPQEPQLAGSAPSTLSPAGVRFPRTIAVYSPIASSRRLTTTQEEEEEEVERGEVPPGQEERGEVPPGQEERGEVPPGQEERGEVPPGQEERGEVPPGQEERGEVPPGQEERGEGPPGQEWPGEGPPGQEWPQEEPQEERGQEPSAEESSAQPPEEPPEEPPETPAQREEAGEGAAAAELGPQEAGPQEAAPAPDKSRLRFQFLEQKYGYYHCKECNIRWESAYVWCVQGTNKVYFRQFCRTCQKSFNPYRVEDIICQSCKQTRCTCPIKLRHVDPKRPHRQDLCGRCKGKRLSCDSTFSFKYII